MCRTTIREVKKFELKVFFLKQNFEVNPNTTPRVSSGVQGVLLGCCVGLWMLYCRTAVRNWTFFC